MIDEMTEQMTEWRWASLEVSRSYVNIETLLVVGVAEHDIAFFGGQRLDYAARDVVWVYHVREHRVLRLLIGLGYH